MIENQFIIFLHAKGKNSTQIYSKILGFFPDTCLSYSTITWTLRLSQSFLQNNKENFVKKNDDRNENLNLVSEILKDYHYASVQQIAKMT